MENCLPATSWVYISCCQPYWLLLHPFSLNSLSELTIVQADPCSGMVTPQLILNALRHNTILVSVMLANNETGVIQPVAEIVNAVKRLATLLRLPVNYCLQILPV